jgi:integrase/recombinase XerD
MKYVVTDQIVLMRPPEGPVAEYIRSFASWAKEQGYGLAALRQRIRLAAGFSRWLGEQAFCVRAIGSQHCAQYLRGRGQRPHTGERVALNQFVEFLCRQDVITAEKAPPLRLIPAEQSAQAFGRYLREERLLSEASQINYVPFIRDFLTDRFGDGPVKLARVGASDVTGFVQRWAPRMHRKRAQLLTAGLRSFLRYARYRGEIRVDLAAAVPSVANWSMPSIPRGIAADQVRQLLSRVDRSTAVGRRDYAILLLLARLGLRASEVVRLELEDIDWRAGCLSVCGKGGRRHQLPLPKDVGEAIVAYLKRGRPPTPSRRVFLRSRAPLRGFAGPSSLDAVVSHALACTGIDAPTRGAHQFRHGLASEMLRRGASLSEIGELLGHRSPETTKIYTKVDLVALRTLALPWPGGVR